MKTNDDFQTVPYQPITTTAIAEDGEYHDLPMVRTRFNYPMDAVSHSSGLVSDETTKTQQQYAEETDINTIVRRFGLTGQLPESMRIPEYADYENVFDFQTSMNAVRSASEAFMEMPAHIRAEFRNDPQIFLEFVADEKNRERAEALGLAVKASKPTPAPDTALVPAPGETSSST